MIIVNGYYTKSKRYKYYKYLESLLSFVSALQLV